MMHIFSHFCLWLSAVVLYAVFYPVSWGNGDCAGINGFLFAAEYPVCEGIPSWDGSGLCPFGK